MPSAVDRGGHKHSTDKLIKVSVQSLKRRNYCENLGLVHTNDKRTTIPQHRVCNHGRGCHKNSALLTDMAMYVHVYTFAVLWLLKICMTLLHTMYLGTTVTHTNVQTSQITSTTYVSTAHNTCPSPSLSLSPPHVIPWSGVVTASQRSERLACVPDQP